MSLNNVIKIAIVEDDVAQAELLIQYLKRYGKENQCSFETCHFQRASDFKLNANNSFQIIFMDIDLPDGNGMELARELRKTDKKTLVIFITNLTQYAVKGYEVRAFDFIVKPISYYNFALKFISALESIETNRDVEILIKTKDGKVKLLAAQIFYVEVASHYLTYHTAIGNFTVLGTITNAAKDLEGSAFSFCNRCYLVNLKYVEKVKKTDVLVGGEWLQISRHKYASFVKDINDYFAGGN